MTRTAAQVPRSPGWRVGSTLESGVFRSRQQRRQFVAEVAAAVEAVRDPVQVAVAKANVLLDAAAGELATMPGAAAR
jgi:hypothetical protein